MGVWCNRFKKRSQAGSSEAQFGGDWMLADERAIPGHHTAEVLRPWPVQRAVDHHISISLRPEFLAKGGKAMKASIFPSVRSCTASALGCVTQVMSFWGLSPTYAAILAVKTCSGLPSALTATVFPFTSRIARTRSVPNS